MRALRGGEHAVEEVDAAPDRLDDVFGGPHPHEIANPIGREQRNGGVEHPEPLLEGLADREAPDRVAVESDLHADPSRCVRAAVRTFPTLARCRTAPPGLPACALARARRPAQRAFHRFAGPRLVQGVLGTVVERHHHVGPERPLDRHRALRRRGRTFEPSIGDRNSTPASVIDRREPRLNTWNPPESVRIGRLPVHEAMQTAERFDGFGPRSQHQVERVGDDDPRPEAVELLGHHRLDRRIGPDRHERGQIDDAARERRPCAACLAVGRFQCERASVHGAKTTRSGGIAATNPKQWSPRTSASPSIASAANERPFMTRRRPGRAASHRRS